MVAFVKCTQGKHRGYVGKVVAHKTVGHLTLKWGLPWTTPAVVPGTDCVPLGYAISVQQLHNHNMATYALQEEDWDPGGLRVHFVHLRLLRDALITHLADCGRSSFLHDVRAVSHDALCARLQPPAVHLDVLLQPASEMDGDADAKKEGEVCVVPAHLRTSFESVQPLLATPTSCWQQWRGAAGVDITVWLYSRTGAFQWTVPHPAAPYPRDWDRFAAFATDSWHPFPADDVWSAMASSGLATHLEMNLLARTHGVRTHQRLLLRALECPHPVVSACTLDATERRRLRAVLDADPLFPDMATPMWDVLRRLGLTVVAAELPVVYPFGLVHVDGRWRVFETRIDVVARCADGDGLVVGEYKTLPGGATPVVARIAAKRDLQQVVLNAFLLVCCARVRVSHVLLLYATRDRSVTSVLLPFEYSPFVASVIDAFVTQLRPLYVDTDTLLNDGPLVLAPATRAQVLTDVLAPQFHVVRKRVRHGREAQTHTRVQPYAGAQAVDMVCVSTGATPAPEPWAPPHPASSVVYKWECAAATCVDVARTQSGLQLKRRNETLVF